MNERPDVGRWLTEHHVVMEGDALVCRAPHTALDWTMFEEIIRHPHESDAKQHDACCEPAARHAMTLAQAAPEPIHRRFEVRAQLNPGARAVKFGDDELTYGELDSQADSLAVILQEQGLAPLEVCAVLMPESLAMVRAILAVLKAGGVCLMLDPGEDCAQLAATLRAAGARTVIAQRAYLACLTETDAKVVCCDDDAGGCHAYWPNDCVTDGVSPVSPVCAVCRGGDGDAPTIVFQQHIDVLDRLESMQARAPIGQGDSLLQGAEHAPDEAFWQSLWPLTQGARLVIVPPRERMDLERMRQLIEREHITVMHVNFRG
ncbi:surfactin family lipopeptide synthetase A [Paraburkholderia bannensis]|uniref:Surfactin family lipopeptide synthetase A n=1 Tax=Paraburkholderia bannensis TaxID=765414 RepID=A0A7W9WRX3_9BURK|nr:MULTISPECIES: AMP-binding protein [Paraburkholderia]MBB3258637.1 surfactin family lipopeptide synthetase A [Paraburkholderia sp. WP4_3_2]MBB6103650.1 surfactin family lipopeptide synthetase A [Paraburkholderia bannensis]